MDLTSSSAVSLSRADTVSMASLQYLKDLEVKSNLRKISESRIVSVEDVVELTGAVQAALSSAVTAA